MKNFLIQNGLVIPTKITKHKPTFKDLVTNDIRITSGLYDVYDVEYKVIPKPTKKD